LAWERPGVRKHLLNLCNRCRPSPRVHFTKILKHNFQYITMRFRRQILTDQKGGLHNSFREKRPLQKRIGKVSECVFLTTISLASIIANVNGYEQIGEPRERCGIESSEPCQYLVCEFKSSRDCTPVTKEEFAKIQEKKEEQNRMRIILAPLFLTSFTALLVFGINHLVFWVGKKKKEKLFEKKKTT